MNSRECTNCKSVKSAYYITKKLNWTELTNGTAYHCYVLLKVAERATNAKNTFKALGLNLALALLKAYKALVGAKKIVKVLKRWELLKC